MDIRENNNFKSVSLYTMGDIKSSDLMKSGMSFHFGNDRKHRNNIVSDIDKNPVIDRCFLVDKDHKDGSEVHVVTKEGIIYVYNLMKLFFKSNNALVTILIARPNQVKRLYDACHINVGNDILEKCAEHQRMRLNCA